MPPRFRLFAAALLVTLGSAHAQLWQSPETTAAQAILKDFTAKDNVLTRGDTTISLDVAGNVVVGVLVEAGTLTDLARGIAVGWDVSEANLPKLLASVNSPQVLAAARDGFTELTDASGTDLIAMKSAGEGDQTRYAAYVAIKVWPDSAFPQTVNVTGSETAPDTLRIFSDFQCPYCHEMWNRSAKGWEAVPETYRMYHYQFPLPMHRNAMAAAEASECAGVQGKFWPYADALFAAYDTWTPLDPKDVPGKFAAYAGAAGLDTAAFKTCLGQHTSRASIDAQIGAGVAVNVQGTPTVYLNGVKLATYSDAAELARVHAATTAAPSAAELIDERLKRFQ